MVAGIYYGAKYGGSTTSILLNIPGEVDSVVTCLDGYQMALQGRAGPALGISAFGSFIAGTFATLGLMLVAPALAKFALRFGPPEIFALMVLAMTLITFMSSGSQIKGLAMAILGLFLGSIGLDVFENVDRFVFGYNFLLEGLGIVPVIMGLFGVGEVLANLEIQSKGEVFQKRVSNLLPSLKDWKDSFWPIMRGTFIGFFIGLIPGGGGMASTFTSYSIEKRLSRHPEKFGRGAIEGVAGPEAANNACSGANFIPLMTLGVPTNGIMAIIFASLLINGLQPGPLLIRDNPAIFWGVIASMYVGNVMLVISEFAADRNLGAVSYDSLLCAGPPDPFFLPSRLLHHEECRPRSRGDAHLRDSRVSHEKVPLRRSSPHHGFHHQRDGGRILYPLPAHVQRGFFYFFHPADIVRSHGHCPCLLHPPVLREKAEVTGIER